MVSTAGVTYTYDGDGQRVKKSNGKLYWYGINGEVLAESDLAGTECAILCDTQWAAHSS